MLNHCSKLHVHQLQGQVGDCVLLRFQGEIPVFGKDELMKTEKGAVLATETLRTMCYVKHFHAYQVVACLISHTFIALNDLTDHYELSIYQPHNSPTTFLKISLKKSSMHVPYLLHVVHVRT